MLLERNLTERCLTSRTLCGQPCKHRTDHLLVRQGRWGRNEGALCYQPLACQSVHGRECFGRSQGISCKRGDESNSFGQSEKSNPTHLLQPYAWEGLKRALRSRQIRIESLGQALGLVSTVSLEPEPIPLDIKVILLGDRLLYYLLCSLDPDFGELFKVEADFDDRTARTSDNEMLYARFMGAVARQEGLRPLDRAGVARAIEHLSRAAGDAGKLSTHLQTLVDLLGEADYWAERNGNGSIGATEVLTAIDARIGRSDRLRERLQEETLRGTILVDTDGEKVGQINGLSVLQLGDFSFGHPSRITARVRLGKGQVVDIEREVELGGPVHSKGVLILSGFLGARYAAQRPLSLSASLVFEQSYGGVEGDSASSAELYALLSAISGLPIRQSLAVTGSVNQLGQVQAIGGVNERIEGFFDVCEKPYAPRGRDRGRGRWKIQRLPGRDHRSGNGTTDRDACRRTGRARRVP